MLSPLDGALAICLGVLLGRTLGARLDRKVIRVSRHGRQIRLHLIGTVALAAVIAVAVPAQFRGLLQLPTASAQGGGSTWLWGNATTSPSVVAGLGLVTMLAGGANAESTALKSDGTVWTFNSTAGATQVSGLSNVTAIAQGKEHRLALKSDGTVWAWGKNDRGQLGDGTTTDRSTPVQVLKEAEGGPVALTNVVSIAAGEKHSVAAATDGQPYGWGANDIAQAGPYPNTDRTVAAAVLKPVDEGLFIPFDNIIAVFAGGNHSLALASDSSAWSWGQCNYGAVGRNIECGTQPSGLFAGTVKDTDGSTALTGVSHMAGGGRHSVIVKTDGTVLATGDHTSGQLGCGSCTTTFTIKPVQVLGPGGVGQLSGAAHAAAGEFHSLIRKTDQTVWAFGGNAEGQLGDATTTNRNTPVQVKGVGGSGFLTGVSAIGAGYRTSLATGQAQQSQFDFTELPLTEHGPPSPCQTESRDPVNTYTGAFVYRRTDAAIPGIGPAPVFLRTYQSNNALALAASRLGPGWVHNYGMYVTNGGGTGLTDLYLIGPMGRADHFVDAGGGSYANPLCTDQTLMRNGDTTFTVSNKDQSTWNFTSTGRLASIKDRFGNTAAMTYDGNGRLSTVSDPAARGNLSFNYDPTTGLLLSVADWVNPVRTVSYTYDAGRVKTVVDREGKTTTYGYDGTSHRLTTITDANGHVAVTNNYDATTGKVTWQRDAKNQQTDFAYSAPGDGSIISTVAYPATSFQPSWRPVVEDTYNAQGLLTNRIAKPANNPVDNAKEEYTYDSRGFRTSVKDPRDNLTTICYDVDFNGTTISGSRGNVTRQIAPAPASGDNVPLVTLYKYDAKNNVTMAVPPKGAGNGASVTCTTDLSAAQTSIYRAEFSYDAATSTKLESTTRRYTDPDTGAQTAITKYLYEDTANPGVVTKVIPPRGNTGGTPDLTYATSMAYFTSGTKSGLLESVTDPLGNKTTYDYDAVGRRTSMVDPLGNNVGGVPGDHTWLYEYDKEDRLRFARTPAPIVGGSRLVTESRYDDVGNRTVAIDANGQVSKYLYDERDSLLEVQESPSIWTDPNVIPSPLYRTEYLYDNNGNLEKVTRAKADTTHERRTEYVYDGLNRMRKETQFPSWPAPTPTLVTEYTYDPVGNGLTFKDPLNQTTTFTYDPLNRLTNVDYSDSGTSDVSYSYDRHSNRTVLAATGQPNTMYAYDEFDRLLSVADVHARTVGYRYDLDGNRTKVIYPGGTGAVTYTFDKASRLTGLQDWASRTTSYEYFANGQPKKTTLPNGTRAHHTYDNALRLTDLWNQLGPEGTPITVTRYGYTLDAVGNRARIDEVLAHLGTPNSAPSPGAVPNSFAPAALQTAIVSYRTANDVTPIPAYTVTIKDGGGQTVRTIAASAGQPFVVWDGKDGSGTIQQPGSYTAEIAGQPNQTITLTRQASLEYRHDRLYRLTQAFRPNGPSTYAYDPVGNRLSKADELITTPYGYDKADRITSAGATTYTVNANGNITSRGGDTFTYDQPNRLKTAAISGTTTAYAYDGEGKRSSQTVSSTTTNSTYDVNASLPILLDDGTRKYVWGRGLVYAVSGSAIEVYHTDGLGSVRAITDGTTPTPQVTATYLIDEFGTAMLTLPTTGGTSQPFGYAGEQRDANGLVYLRNRVYEPSIGRFVQRDLFTGTATNPSTLHRYSYVENRPVTRTDPAGRKSQALGTVKTSFDFCDAGLLSTRGFFAAQITPPTCRIVCGYGTGCALQCGPAPSGRNVNDRPKTEECDEECDAACWREYKNCLADVGIDYGAGERDPGDGWLCLHGYGQCVATGGCFENPGWRHGDRAFPGTLFPGPKWKKVWGGRRSGCDV